MHLFGDVVSGVDEETRDGEAEAVPIGNAAMIKTDRLYDPAYPRLYRILAGQARPGIAAAWSGVRFFAILRFYS